MTKLKILCLLLLVSDCAFSRTFYFSNSDGNDSYTTSQAQSSSTPWKSIAKFNSFFASLLPGDNVLFKNGDEWAGTSMYISRSGTLAAFITIGTYGTGPKAKFTGYTTITSWTAVGGGVYRTATTAKARLRNVMVNDSIMGMGRYPNNNAANGGFLTYQSFSGNTTITSSDLAGGPNWVGAYAIINKSNHLLERCLVKSFSSNTIGYQIDIKFNGRNGTAISSTPQTVNRGFFIEDDLRTLDQLGEWYIDKASKNFSMYFGSADPAAYTVKISTVDTLINLNTKSYINIVGLDLRGSDFAAISSNDNQFIKIQDCDFYDNGQKGILLWNAGNVTVDNCYLFNCSNSAIDITSRNTKNDTVRNCVVVNAGNRIISNISRNDDNDGKAISVSADSSGVIGCTIKGCGYVGVQFQGRGFLVKGNIILWFNEIKSDGGGIYTYSNPLYKGRVIEDNIIMYTSGNSIYGNRGPVAPSYGNEVGHDEGIYCDGGAGGIVIRRNFIAFVKKGLWINDPKFVYAHDNICFRTAGWTVSKNFYDSISDFRMSRNIFINENNKNFLKNTWGNNDISSSNPPTSSTVTEALMKLPGRSGYIDSNVYRNYPASYYWLTKLNPSSSLVFSVPLNFDGWQALSGHDSHSTDLGNLDLSTSSVVLNESSVDSIVVFPGQKRKVFENRVLVEKTDSFTVPARTAMIVINEGALAPRRDWFLLINN